MTTDVGEEVPARSVCSLGGHSRCKPLTDVVAGDIIVPFGTPHLIAEVEPYTGPLDGITGVARAADGWGISLGGYGCVEVG